MLTVHIPGSARKEREYVLEILLRQWLGVDFDLQVHPGLAHGMVLLGERGSMTQPDLFLPVADRDWGGEETCPGSSQLQLRRDLPSSWSQRIGEDSVPVLFSLEDQPLVSHQQSADGVMEVRLGFDLVGTTFFFLSRYEELARSTGRDQHDRFPAAQSCAGQAGLLHRPIVNEYLELLWLVVSQLEPSAERRARRFEIIPTHDIDRPYQYRGIGPLKFAKRSAIRLRRGESVASVLESGAGWMRSRFADARKDPFFTFPWILDASEPLELKNTFYLQCTRSSLRQDDNYDHLDSGLCSVLGDAVRRGHHVGLHPGYGTYRDLGRLQEELSRFHEFWDRLGAGEPGELRTRQHYLRWDQAVTPKLLQEAGFTRDSTLGFADSPGFRCGCCYSYPLYDLTARQPLSVIEDPLILMECSIIDDRYLGLGTGREAVELARQVSEKCRLFEGRFVYLWHNHRFVDQAEREIYRALLTR